MKPTEVAKLFGRAALAATVFGALPTMLRAQPAALVSDSEVITQVPEGTIITPGSSIERPEDAGIRAHTNIKLFLPKGHPHLYNSKPTANSKTPPRWPASTASPPLVAGCNPETLTTVATAAAASSPSSTRSTTRTPPATLPSTPRNMACRRSPRTTSRLSTRPERSRRRIRPAAGNSKKPSTSNMAHALAPNAKIILIEAATNSNADLMLADKVAAKLVEAGGGGEVSPKLGRQGIQGRGKIRAGFRQARRRVLRLRRRQPRHHLSVRHEQGRQRRRHADLAHHDGDYIEELSWPSSGGGPSKAVPVPTYQAVVSKVVGKRRGVPDISLDASPISGAWIYDTIPYHGSTLNWTTIGGTSLASPAAAALVNNAGHFKQDIARGTDPDLRPLRQAKGFPRHHQRRLPQRGETAAPDRLGLLHRRRHAARQGWEVGVGRPGALPLDQAGAVGPRPHLLGFAGEPLNQPRSANGGLGTCPSGSRAEPWPFWPVAGRTQRQHEFDAFIAPTSD